MYDVYAPPTPTTNPPQKKINKQQDCGIVRDGETIYFAIAPPAAALGGGSGPVLRPYGLLAPPKRLMRSLKQVGAGDRVGLGWKGTGCSVCGLIVPCIPHRATTRCAAPWRWA